MKLNTEEQRLSKIFPNYQPCGTPVKTSTGYQNEITSDSYGELVSRCRAIAGDENDPIVPNEEEFKDMVNTIDEHYQENKITLEEYDSLIDILY